MPAPVTTMPFVVLLAMTLVSKTFVPPMVLLLPVMEMPVWLAAVVPSGATPM